MAAQFALAVAGRVFDGPEWVGSGQVDDQQVIGFPDSGDKDGGFGAGEGDVALEPELLALTDGTEGAPDGEDHLGVESLAFAIETSGDIARN